MDLDRPSSFDGPSRLVRLNIDIWDYEDWNFVRFWLENKMGLNLDIFYNPLANMAPINTYWKDIKDGDLCFAYSNYYYIRIYLFFISKRVSKSFLKIKED